MGLDAIDHGAGRGEQPPQSPVMYHVSPLPSGGCRQGDCGVVGADFASFIASRWWIASLRPAAGRPRRVVWVLAAGVCHSDLHMIDGAIGGPLSRVLGHEIAGHVEGIGEVLVYPCWADGTCEYCRRGLEQLCPAAASPGWTVDGGFAEQVLVPHPRFLLPLGDLDPVRAAPLADAGVTPYRAVRRALPWLTEGATALVIGAGGLGSSRSSTCGCCLWPGLSR